MLDFCIKCLKMTQLFSIHFVELCTYLIPNVYNNVQTRQIHELTQGNGAFILIACYRNFWDREVHERDIEKKIQNITSSVNICVTIIYNFLLAMVVWPQDNLCLFMLRSVHPPKTAKLL